MAIGDKKPVVMESDRAVPGGVATLGTDGKLLEPQWPPASGLLLPDGKTTLGEALEAKAPLDSPALTGSPAVNGMDVDTILRRAQAGGELDNLRPGVNLLDNWYFADPINQRGQTEYSGAEYTIDRWRLVNSYGSIKIQGNSLLLSASGGVAFFRQVFADPNYLFGKLVTISVLLADGRLFFATGTLPDAPGTTNVSAAITWIAEGTSYFSLVADTNGSVYAQFRVGDGNSHDLLAVKVELGSVQTLAHQDTDGNWVLNDPPPNKALELAKCQRYYERDNDIFVYSASTSAFEYYIPWKASKRIDPVLSVISKNGVVGAVSYFANDSFVDIDVSYMYGTTSGARIAIVVPYIPANIAFDLIGNADL